MAGGAAAFSPWQTVYDAFARWRQAGVFAALMDGMIAEAAARGQVDLSLVGVDSTVARAHQDAAGMVVDPAVLASLEQAAAQEKGRQAADSPRFVAVLEQIKVRGPIGRPRTRPGAVAADKAYSSQVNRAYLHRRHIMAVILEKVDQAANRKKRGAAGGRPVAFDAERYRGPQHRGTLHQQDQGMA